MKLPCVGFASLILLSSALHAAEIEDEGRHVRTSSDTAEVRLRRIEDRLVLNDLEAEYARSYDSTDCAAWASLFTEDGAFEMVPVGLRKGGTIRGQKALRAFCQQYSRSQPGLHYFQPPSLTLAGDQATAEIRTQWVSIAGEPGSRVDGHTFSVVRVSYRRTEGGWRILHRQTNLFAEAS